MAYGRNMPSSVRKNAIKTYLEKTLKENSKDFTGFAFILGDRGARASLVRKK
jgi:hypothetical protein